MPLRLISGSGVTPVAEPDARPPSRRVFLIDGKEYPDPDPDLPITGTRSVQAMYRDYFPGQLDNVDVAQKTRDGRHGRGHLQAPHRHKGWACGYEPSAPG